MLAGRRRRPCGENRREDGRGGLGPTRVPYPTRRGGRVHGVWASCMFVCTVRGHTIPRDGLARLAAQAPPRATAKNWLETALAAVANRGHSGGILQLPIPHFQSQPRHPSPADDAIRGAGAPRRGGLDQAIVAGGGASPARGRRGGPGRGPPVTWPAVAST